MKASSWELGDRLALREAAARRKLAFQPVARQNLRGVIVSSGVVTSEPSVPVVPFAMGLCLQFFDKSLEAAFWARVFSGRGRLLVLTPLLVIVSIPLGSPVLTPHFVDNIPAELLWLDTAMTMLAVGVPVAAGFLCRKITGRDHVLIYFFTAASVLVSANYCLLLAFSGVALIGFYTYSMLIVLLISHLFLCVPFRFLLFTSTTACLVYAATLSTFAGSVPVGKLLFALSPIVSFLLILLYVSYLIERSARVNFLYVQNLSREHRRSLKRRENDARFLAVTTDFLGSQLKHAVANLASDLEAIRRKGVNDQQACFLQRASDSVIFMDRLLDETYSSTTLEDALNTIITTEVDLSEILELQGRAYQDMYPEHRFIVHAPASVVASVDRQRLLQAVDKIVHNATEHSVVGSMIRLEVAAEEGQASIRVVNVGNIPDDMERIFSPYVSSKQGSDNIGIGLFIVRRIVESHGGTVRACRVSEPPGVEFLISLPID